MSRHSILKCSLIGTLLAAAAPAAHAQQNAATSPAAAQPVAQTSSYLMRYKLAPKQEIRYEVTHLGKTDTRMQGKEESMQVRTVSTKLWRVTDVATNGEMTFEHLIEHVEMTQQAGDGQELRWNSKSSDAPPAAFEKVADTLGKPLCRVTINSQGQVKKREDFAGSKANLGMGDLVLPLPKDPVRVGGSWIVPRELRIRDKDGEPKVVKVREVYTLDRVATGMATIGIRTEPLTPIEHAGEKAQLVQQLSNGTIKFDLDAGRIASKQLDWDEEVVGFQGDDSMMKYLARMSEEVQQPAAASERSAKAEKPVEQR